MYKNLSRLKRTTRAELVFLFICLSYLIRWILYKREFVAICAIVWEPETQLTLSQLENTHTLEDGVNIGHHFTHLPVPLTFLLRLSLQLLLFFFSH